MNVVLAENAGACYGVKRALDMAYKAAEGAGPVRTLGQLIHNPGVVAELERSGVHVVTSLDDVSEGTIVIRSHGVGPEAYDALEERDVDVVDATCPHVARAQKAATELAEQGCHVIVVGEMGHPEVEGLCAYAKRAGANVDVMSSPDDLPANLHEPIGVVVQTTQRRDNLEAIVEALELHGASPTVKNTICSATSQRQDAAADLASRVDAMVVIGGKNSSNTTRLAEICRMACENTHHVESADELEREWFAACATVGVTAGASTPDDQIEAVMARLAQF